jgi:hypothetical protein
MNSSIRCPGGGGPSTTGARDLGIRHLETASLE